MTTRREIPRPKHPGLTHELASDEPTSDGQNSDEPTFENAPSKKAASAPNRSPTASRTALHDTVERQLKQSLGGNFDLLEEQVNAEPSSLLTLREAARIPDALVKHVPPFLSDLLDTFDRSHTREVVLTSSLAAISSCLPNVQGAYADKWYGPQILTAAIAPAGTGKGGARYARQLIQPVDERLAGWSQDIWAPRTQEQATGEDGHVPVRLQLSADASAAGLVEFMKHADGPVLIFDTEIDNLVSAQRNKWGFLSPLLRQAAEHESFSQRRKGRELRVERPELGMFLAGTLNQFLSLIPSAEDGLFSRITWLYLPPDKRWHSPRPTDRFDARETLIDQSAERLDRLHEALSDRDTPVEFRLTPVQWGVIDDAYTTLKSRAADHIRSSSFDSVIHRNGVLTFRLAMILTTLREAGQITGGSSPPDHLIATDTDFNVALGLSLTYLDHAARLFGQLPMASSSISYRNDDAVRFYDELPNVFDRRGAVELGQEAGIAERTVDKYLRKFVEGGELTRVKRGHYAKPGHESESKYESKYHRGF